MSKGFGIFWESVLYFRRGSRVACKTALSVSPGCVYVYLCALCLCAIRQTNLCWRLTAALLLEPSVLYGAITGL